MASTPISGFPNSSVPPPDSYDFVMQDPAGIPGSANYKINYGDLKTAFGGTPAWGGIGGILSNQLDLQAALDAKVDENVAVVGATKTKITYDAKGLVTAGADATTADIADSLNARYVTDADLVNLGNTSGVNTGDQTLVGLGGVPITRAVNTIAPLSGGGDLSVDRTITTSMNTAKLIGRGTAGVGVMEEITLGTNLSFTGTTLNATGGGGGSFSTTPITINVASPVLWTQVTVVDATVSAASRITLFPGMTTELDINDWIEGDVVFKATPDTGQFIVDLYSKDRSFLFGDYKLQYAVG